MKKLLTYGLLFLLPFCLLAQKPSTEKGVFKVYEPGYFQNSILKGIEDYQSTLPKTQNKTVRAFKADPAAYNFPKSKDEFTTCWHNEPISQGNTNTCWSFSTTSYLDTEVNRITGLKVHTSEMFTVYYEYVERAKQWVKTHGNMYFDEGSEANAVTKIRKKYGCVPYESYTGLLEGQSFYDHSKLIEELKVYMDFIKKNNIWDEQAVVSNVKSILNYYMGEPPAKVKLGAKEYTPLQYMADILKQNPDDYCDVLSYLQQPHWQQVEYEVPDNWWHNSDYYNVPLDDFMKVIKKAISAGYSLSIGGDVSEAGYLAREANAAVVPSFDIPSAYINDDARQFRFSNATTTDDHGMHLVGYLDKEGTTWFLIKDSGAGSRTGGKEKNPNFGYYFFHEDYIKLKMMDCMVHKDAMKDLLGRFSR